MSSENKRLEERCRTISTMLERGEARLHTYISLYGLEKKEASECRVRLAELEGEQVESHCSRVKLLSALASYREEVGSLEELIESMEDESEATIARLRDERHELQHDNETLRKTLQDIEIDSSGVCDDKSTCHLKRTLKAVMEDFWAFSSQQMIEFTQKRDEAKVLAYKLLDHQLPETLYVETRDARSCPSATRSDKSHDVSSDNGIGIPSDALDPLQSMIIKKPLDVQRRIAQ